MDSNFVLIAFNKGFEISLWKLRFDLRNRSIKLQMNVTTIRWLFDFTYCLLRSDSKSTNSCGKAIDSTNNSAYGDISCFVSVNFPPMRSSELFVEAYQEKFTVKLLKRSTGIKSLRKVCEKFWKSTVRLHSVPFPKQ